MLHRCWFHKQVLVFGETSPNFSGGGGKKLKVYYGANGFFSKPDLRDVPRKIRKIVMDICGMGARLIGRS